MEPSECSLAGRVGPERGQRIRLIGGRAHAEGGGAGAPRFLVRVSEKLAYVVEFNGRLGRVSNYCVQFISIARLCAQNENSPAQKRRADEVRESSSALSGEYCGCRCTALVKRRAAVAQPRLKLCGNSSAGLRLAIAMVAPARDWPGPSSSLFYRRDIKHRACQETRRRQGIFPSRLK